MRQFRKYGSVRGVSGNRLLYRDQHRCLFLAQITECELPDFFPDLGTETVRGSLSFHGSLRQAN